VLAPSIQTQLSKIASASNDLSIAVANLVDAERFAVAKQTLAAVTAFFSATKPGNAEYEALKTAVTDPEISKALSSRSNPGWRDAAKKIQGWASKVDVLKRQFLLDAQSHSWATRARLAVRTKVRSTRAQALSITVIPLPEKTKNSQLSVCGLRFLPVGQLSSIARRMETFSFCYVQAARPWRERSV
jgi:hypothetical protein